VHSSSAATDYRQLKALWTGQGAFFLFPFGCQERKIPNVIVWMEKSIQFDIPDVAYGFPSARRSVGLLFP